ncbi:hypothetical protein VPH35_006272 [Triticum aestivum]|uniref:F-box domain-containing protein n=3 Tax=Triticum TaxID=4564 RepID=A0A3B5YSE7_WHEAT|nr:F-box/LRR-repeat protein At4g14103-like isoform X2 [Triticum aestivum]
MNDAAAVTSEKRRREEPLAAGAAASASKMRRRDKPEPQEAPASADDEDATLDRISELPADILGSILSLLPTKEAARTAVLSSAWRDTWRSAPLNLAVDDDLAGQERNRITAVSEILASHRGPVRRLSLDTIRLGRDRFARFDGWFRSPALDGLEELNFYGDGTQPRLPPPRPLPLPPSALRFGPTLRAASIGGCDFPQIDAAPVLSFPKLKRLKLYDVCISEAALHGLLAGCTVLERLHLQDIYGFSTVRIISPTLRCIGVSVCPMNEEHTFQELVIEDAPCLERMMQVGPVVPGKIKVIAAPKLTVLGYVSTEMHKLLIGTLILKENIPIPFTGSACTVKILVLGPSSSNGEAFVEFLRCFPCLEKLCIQSYLEKVRESGTLVDPINCLDLHLREIVLNGYRGNKRNVNFAKFFILNARVLKVMKFGVSGNCDEKWISNQREQLHLDNRASTDAQFYFGRDDVTYPFYIGRDYVPYPFFYNEHIYGLQSDGDRKKLPEGSSALQQKVVRAHDAARAAPAGGLPILFFQ